MIVADRSDMSKSIEKLGVEFKLREKPAKNFNCFKIMSIKIISLRMKN